MELEIDIFKCPYCNETFETHRNKFNSHVYYCKYNPKHEEIIEHLRLKAKEYAAKKKLEKVGEIKEFTVSCKICGKLFNVFEPEKLFPIKSNYYCSSSCSHTRKHTEETKNKIRNTLINKPYTIINKSNIPNKKCKVCGKEYVWHNHKRFIGVCTKNFCSPECSTYYREHKKEFLSQEAIVKLRETGKKSALKQSEVRRSKNEKLFCELCELHFDKVTHNDPIFNGWDADVLIWDYKVAVLWNGKWHYEKITDKHSVEQVLNRDKIKCKEIQTKGWNVYIIKDLKRYNPTFVKELFELFLQYINLAGIAPVL